MSTLYGCLGYIPNQFLPIYSLVFLFALPVFLHFLLFIFMCIFKSNETTNTQVYPAGHIDPTGVNDQSIMKYIFIMGLLFAIIGFGPRAILLVMDLNLQQSIAIYAALEILPSFCLLIDIGLFYIMNREVRKKITSVCGC